MNANAVFDILAKTYDVDFTTSQIGQLQRKRVRTFLTRLLNEMNRPLKILEINCGTGEDALWLSSLGHAVVATDASAAMIEKANSKLSNNNEGSSNINFLQCSFHQLAHIFKEDQFDLVFSNFGGLNCVSEEVLMHLSNDLSTLTKNDGQLFFVIMPKNCLWEILYYSIKGKFKTAFRRRNSSIDFAIDKEQVPVYYYSPGKLKKLFNTAFQCLNKKPVGLFIPPSYLEKQFGYRTKQLNRLNRWEEKCSPAALASFADHYCISFIKTLAKK
jgi:ubiquinone/menaquinone biosynthesis C-methylase UbiE